MRKRKLYDDLTTNDMVSQVLLLGRTIFWIRHFYEEVLYFEKSVRPDNFYARTDFSKTTALGIRPLIEYHEVLQHETSHFRTSEKNTHFMIELYTTGTKVFEH